MMTSVKIVLLVIISLALCECRAGSADDGAPESPLQEEPCSSEGGICALEEFCPARFRISEKGLCPTQQHKGVECCGIVPSNLRSCEDRGGECYAAETCRKIPSVTCPAGEACCLLE
ncbi:U-scoloptoxin(19)-Tl1a-like [Macrobrachium rosenbergii]|uniref:U-scoloptoxin(19)-Tl1a-like n=1 Tax=Macrobrachium rosenbergii TaxID=79674 RepID=UPI0034D4AEA0